MLIRWLTLWCWWLGFGWNANWWDIRFRHLTIRHTPPILLIQRMLSIRSWLWFQGDEFLIDKRKLDSSGYKFSISHTSPIIHVQVNGYKLGHKCSEDIKHTPFFSNNIIKMKLAYNLINIVKILNRKIFKSRIFTSFTIYFKKNISFKQFICF